MEYIYRNPLIICICGKARSGKSTVSSYLYKLFTSDHKKVIVSQYTKYLKKYIEDVTGKDILDDSKPRDLLQNYSKDIIKGILGDRDFFIRRQIEDINFYAYFFDVIIINDVRFPMEIEELKARFDNVLSIGVKRDNYSSDLSIDEMNDITETALDGYNDFDYVIYNDNIDSLKSDTFKLFEDIKMR